MLQTLAIQESVRLKKWADLSVILALAQLSVLQDGQRSPHTVRSRQTIAKSLSAFFRNRPLRSLRPEDLEAYQSEKLHQGKATSTINAQLKLLRQLLRRANLWHKFEPTFRPLSRTEPPRAKAITAEEIERLFAVAYSRKSWKTCADALTLALCAGMRSAEIKHLQWNQISFTSSQLTIRHSKTPAGWRTIQLNQACLQMLRERYADGLLKGFAEPNHFIFPRGGRIRPDPAHPLSSLFRPWDRIRKMAGVQARFHDCRHTAVTAMIEAGVPVPVIQAHIGHSQLLLTYSHPRTEAMRQASNVLERKPPLPVKSEPQEKPNENRSQAQGRVRKGRLLRRPDPGR